MRIRKTLVHNESDLRKILERSYSDTESKCLRKKVAVALLNPWNGWVHETFVNQSQGSVCSGERGKCGCSHAEPLAIMWLLRNSDEDASFIMTSTYAPCSNCANLIVSCARITAVAFAHFTDHDATGIGILTRNDIATLHIQTDIPETK